MALEIERKYLEVDFDSLRRRLRQCGAQGGDVHLERNRIYDLPDGSLRAGHHLLRLRSQEWPDHAQNVLTLKLPPVSAPDAAFKVREERETPVTDAAQMHSILEGLGYVVRACYEKIRETWRLEHTSIDMDIVPFARVVELEGPEEEILRLEFPAMQERAFTCPKCKTGKLCWDLTMSRLVLKVIIICIRSGGSGIICRPTCRLCSRPKNWPAGAGIWACLPWRIALMADETWNEPGTDTATIVKKKVKEPDRYVVLLHNDDYTSMDFVVGVLCDIFHKTPEEATAIMLAVHQQGIGQCGVYTHEIAETKVALVRRRARAAGFPLRCTMEKYR